MRCCSRWHPVEAEEAGELVVEVMAGAAELWVPLEVNLSVGTELGCGEGVSR